MNLNIYHYIFFFFVFSFIGWILEEIIAAFKYGKFVNRGFINGPMCMKYGFIMCISIVDIKDLSEYPLYQCIVIVGIVAVAEYLSGVILKAITGKRFWDYSDRRWNLNGYICLESVVSWTAAFAVFIWFVFPFAYMVFEMVPISVVKALEIAAIIILFIDLIVTIGASLKWKFKGSLYGNISEILEKTKSGIGMKIVAYIEKRLYKAFPEFAGQEKNAENGFGKPEKERVFAKGLCLDKLVWMFFISALVGDWIETIFMWATTGEIMSRSSLIYGTFSIVWGLGGAIATGILYPLKEKNDRYIFFGGFFMGGVYEYSCSVFTEYVFGTTFWDYSHLPFNINGRVNLLFCFFWGVMGIVWVKLLYPSVSRIIEKIRPVTGKVLTWSIVLFMGADIIISSVAMGRYVMRKSGVEAKNVIVEFLDSTYSDAFIERIYPNMKITGNNAIQNVIEYEKQDETDNNVEDKTKAEDTTKNESNN